MQSDAIAVARKACRRTPLENREYVKAGLGRARLPVWFALLETLREKLWKDRGFGRDGMDSKMTYITAMFGFDLAARAGEATATGRESNEHTILCEDLTIHLKQPVLVEGQPVTRIRGGSDTFCDLVEVDNVAMIEVAALTHKVGQINTTKQITRDGEESEEFLEDLVEFMKHSGAISKKPLFSRRVMLSNKKMSFKKCTARMVTEAIKGEVAVQGLSADLFSFHSLRKGAVTQMKAIRVDADETRARGNYSQGSEMIATIYNYDSSGVGPLAAMARGTGKAPTKEDIARTIPVSYN
jgi:hypothetical protein